VLSHHPVKTHTCFIILMMLYFNGSLHSSNNPKSPSGLSPWKSVPTCFHAFLSPSKSLGYLFLDHFGAFCFVYLFSSSVSTPQTSHPSDSYSWGLHNSPSFRNPSPTPYIVLLHNIFLSMQPEIVTVYFCLYGSCEYFFLQKQSWSPHIPWWGTMFIQYLRHF
jgi:hypothetical protein